MNTIMSRPFLIIILILIAVAVAAVLTYQGERTREPAVEEQQGPVKDPIETRDSMPEDHGVTDTTPVADSLDTEQLSGKILLTGTAHQEFISLDIEGGDFVNLGGPLLSELRNLSGAKVSVHGRRTTATPLIGFEVTSYEVLSIHGKKPTVGILLESDGEFTVAGARLTGVSDWFRRHVGAKVFVVGRRTATGLQVQSYGVIREP